MIITKIEGGLGNQMFQYAFGRTLATRNNSELKLDITPFETFKLFPYSLDNFNIDKNYATEDELRPFLKCRPRQGRLGRFILNPFFYDSNRYIIEKDFCFQPEMLNLKDPCYVDGYWQSEKYFLDIENEIRKEFTLRNPLGQYSKLISKKISSVENPVSLHIRRNDRVKDERTKILHGSSSEEYYKEAMNIINEKTKNPTYFVFSDDIEWARANVKTGFPTEFIGQGHDKNYEDMELMRLCKHHILANSTFGWWGAWLSDHYKTGITIAPKRWNIKFDTKDLLPKHWIVLSL